MADQTAFRLVAAEMTQRNWKQVDLVRESKTNKNTVSDFFRNRGATTSPATLAKFEKALGMIPGTLVGAGEDVGRQAFVASSRSLDDVTTQRLLATLSERISSMEETMSDWHRPADRYDRRTQHTAGFAVSHEADDDSLGVAARRWLALDALDAVRDLTISEELEWDDVTLELDAARWRKMSGLAAS